MNVPTGNRPRVPAVTLAVYGHCGVAPDTTAGGFTKVELARWTRRLAALRLRLHAAAVQRGRGAV